MLVKAEQIVGEAHTQKGTYGRVKVLHAEAVGLPIVLEFFDVLLTTSALVVIVPELRAIAPLFQAIGHKDTKGITIHIDETPPHRALALRHTLADSKKSLGFDQSWNWSMKRAQASFSSMADHLAIPAALRFTF